MRFLQNNEWGSPKFEFGNYPVFISDDLGFTRGMI
jgi:hypothetical protein